MGKKLDDFNAILDTDPVLTDTGIPAESKTSGKLQDFTALLDSDNELQDTQRPQDIAAEKQKNWNDYIDERTGKKPVTFADPNTGKITPLKITNTDKPRTFTENMGESWSRGNEDLWRNVFDSLQAASTVGGEDLSMFPQVSQYRKLQEQGDPVKADNWFSKQFHMVGGMAPGLVAGALTNMIAPGAGVGLWTLQGAGDMYRTLRDDGVGKKTAMAVAAPLGYVYGKIEGLQAGQAGLTKPFKDKLYKIMDGLAKEGWKKAALKYGVNVIKEAGEEGLQQITQEVANYIGKGANDLTNDTNFMKTEFTADKFGQSAKNVADAFLQSIIPMAIISVPGHVYNGAKYLKTLEQEGQRKAAGLPPVTGEGQSPIVADPQGNVTTPDGTPVTAQGQPMKVESNLPADAIVIPNNDGTPTPFKTWVTTEGKVVYSDDTGRLQVMDEDGFNKIPADTRANLIRQAGEKKVSLPFASKAAVANADPTGKTAEAMIDAILDSGSTAILDEPVKKDFIVPPPVSIPVPAPSNNIYMKIARVQQDAETGVLAAKEALKLRQAEFAPAPDAPAQPDVQSAISAIETKIMKISPAEVPLIQMEASNRGWTDEEYLAALQEWENKQAQPPVEAPVAPVEQPVPITQEPIQPQVGEEVKQYATSEDVQGDIDALEDTLVSKYGGTKILSALLRHEAELKSGKTDSKNPVSDSEFKQWQNLYDIRERIDTADLNTFIDKVASDSGLSKTEAEKALKQLTIAKGDGTNVAMTSQALNRWGVDVLLNLKKLYNYFADTKSFAEFKWSDNPDNPELMGKVYDEDIVKTSWDKDALAKTEKLYNAIARNRGETEINLSNIKDSVPPPKKSLLKEKDINNNSPATSRRRSNPVQAGQSFESWKTSASDYLALMLGIPKEHAVMRTNEALSGDGTAMDRDVISAHRIDIKKALSEGKPVPTEVLKDYPDLSKPVQKSLQKQVVKDALAKGEEVDPMVLEGYPDLQKKPDPKSIGKNSDGQDIMVDDKGARYFVKNGIRVTQPVGMIPTRTGVQMRIADAEQMLRNGQRQFVTVEEQSNYDKAQAIIDEAKAANAEADKPDNVRKRIDAGVRETAKNQLAAGKITQAQYDNVILGQNNMNPDLAEPVKVKSPLANLSPEEQARMKVIQDRIAQITMKRTSVGLDPELIPLGVEMVNLYVKGGIKTFKQFASNVKQDMAGAWDGVKGYLHGIWITARAMDTSLDDVNSADAKSVIDEIDGQGEAVESPLRSIIMNDDSMMKKTTTLSMLAKKQGISVKQIQEAVEVEIVKIADEIARDNSLTSKEKFDKMMDLYKKQPNLNMRTSTSIENQAYSTPAPLAFAISDALGVTEDTALYEPTAGNGMLAIGADKTNSEMNELNPDRAKNLESLGFQTVTGNDASTYTPNRKFPVTIMNPPFGKIPNVNYNGFSITKLDNIIALKALEAMDDDGTAAIILGAKRVNEAGGQGADWIFKNYLYGNYNVVDNFEVDGDLYRKQGAAFPVQVLIISGRKAESNVQKLEPKALDRLGNWDDIYNRLQGVKNEIENRIQALDVAGRPLPNGAMAVGQLPDASEAGSTTLGSSKPSGATGGTGKRGGNKRGKPSASGQSAPIDAGLPSGQSSKRPGDSVSTDGTSSGDGNQLSGMESGTPGSIGGAVSDTGRNPTDVRGTDTGELFGSDSVKESEYQAPYRSASKGTLFDSLIPKSIAKFNADFLKKFIAENGRPEDYLASRLKMSPEQIMKVMAAEQIDGVAMAVKQIEDGGALIIGDETGLGKGRQAAAIIKYAKANGKIPIFFTQDPKLFSDMFRDVTDIGTQVKPLILGDADKATIVDNSGEVKIKALSGAKQKAEIARIRSVGMDKAGYDSIFLTYSQIRDQGHRQDFIEDLANNEDTIIVLDEAHNAAGDANASMQAAFISGGTIEKGSGANKTTTIKTGILNMPGTKQGRGGVLYLSATWAKRPDNLPVFFRTAMSKSARNFTDIVNAMTQGGVALQQALTEALAQVGQYIRREKDFTGITFDTKAVEVADIKDFKEKVDSVSDVLSRIVSFSHEVKDVIKNMNAAGPRSTVMSQTQIDVTEFAAIVHNQIGQLLLSAKADSVVDAVTKEQGKPIVALMNTMESFLEQYAEDHGIKNGDKIQLRWNELLEYALSRTLRTTEKDANGGPIHGTIEPREIGMQAAFDRITEMIKDVNVSFPVSPIDYIIQKAEKNGKKLVELTGRESGIKYTNFDTGEGVYYKFKKINKNKAVNGFNNGDYDGMLMNASGSTGLSLHATPKNGKDTRQRHMIIAQPSNDINVFIQTLGRIKRTGMIVGSAKYTHFVLPLQAELRPAAITSKKMKSLNANLTADAEGTVKIQAEDFLNKYGDRVVAAYLSEHEDLQDILGLHSEQNDQGDEKWPQDLARKFTGRMALRPDAEQERAYAFIIPAYREMVKEMKNAGEYDLEMIIHDDWDATPVSDEILKAGEDDSNLFTSSVRVQQWEIKDERHVPTGNDMRDELKKNIPSQANFMGKFNDRITAAEIEYGSAVDELRKRLTSNPADDEAQLELRKLEARKAKFENMIDSARRLFNHIGGLRNISKDHGESVIGAIVDVTIPEKNLLYVTPGSIKIKALVHVPGGRRTFTLSQVNSGDVVLGAAEKSFADINVKPENNRYKRFFVVGNPISAYIATGNRGKMSRFMTRDGKIITGLEMPNNWNVTQLAHDPRFELVNGKAVKRLFDKYSKQLSTWDNPMTVEIGRVTIMKYPNMDEYTIRVPQSRRSGGDDIYLDSKIRRLVNNGEFEKRRTFMEARFDGSNLVKIADIVSNIMGQNFTVNSNYSIDDKVKAVQDANGTRQHQTDLTTIQITPAQANAQIRKLAANIGGTVTGMLGKVGSTVTMKLRNGFTITIEAMDSIQDNEGQTAGGFIEKAANGYRVGYSLKDGRLTTIPHEALGHVAWNALTATERKELGKFLGTTTDEQAVEKLATMWVNKPDGIKGMAHVAWNRFKRMVENVGKFFGAKVDEGRRLAEDVVSGKIADRIGNQQEQAVNYQSDKGEMTDERKLEIIKAVSKGIEEDQVGDSINSKAEPELDNTETYKKRFAGISQIIRQNGYELIFAKNINLTGTTDDATRSVIINTVDDSRIAPLVKHEFFHVLFKSKTSDALVLHQSIEQSSSDFNNFVKRYLTERPDVIDIIYEEAVSELKLTKQDMLNPAKIKEMHQYVANVLKEEFAATLLSGDVKISDPAINRVIKKILDDNKIQFQSLSLGTESRLDRNPAIPVNDKQSRLKYDDNLSFLEAPEVRHDKEVEIEAKARIGRNHAGEMENLLNGRLFVATSDTDMKVARLLLEELYKDQSPEGIKKAKLATYNYAEIGTEIARALRQRVDLRETPAQRALRLLNSMKYELDPKVKKKLKEAETLEQKMKLLDEQMKEDDWARIEARLKALGLPTDFEKMTEAELQDPILMGKILSVFSQERASWQDKTMEYYRNALMSLPTTATVNMGSNIVNVGTDFVINRVIEGAIGDLVTKLGYKGGDIQTTGELKYIAKYMGKAWATGKRNALLAWQTERPQLEGSMLDSPRTYIKGMDIKIPFTGGYTINTGRFTRSPQRINTWADEYIKGVVWISELAAQAYRSGLQKGFKDGSKEMDLHIDGIVNNPVGTVEEQRALEKAKDLTFQQSNGFAKKFIDMAVKARNVPGIGLFIGLQLPFIQTPTNIVTQGIRKTPLGLLGMGVHGLRGDYSSRPDLLIKHSAEQIIAGGLTIALYSLVKGMGGDGDDKDDPLITGSRAFDRGKKESQYRTIPPQSVYLPGLKRYVSYSRVEPFATMLTPIIDLLELVHEGKNASYNFKRAFSTLISPIRDKTFLQGITQIIDAIEQPQQRLEKLASNQVSAFMPNIIKGSFRAFDPYYRETSVKGDYPGRLKELGKRTLQASVPYSGTNPPPKVDIWGREVKKMEDLGQVGDILWRLLVPAKMQSVNNITNYDRLLINYNNSQKDESKEYWPTIPTRDVLKDKGKSWDMTDVQMNEYLKIRGERVVQLLDRHSFNFDNPTDRDIEKVRVAFREAGEYAKRKMIRSGEVEQVVKR